MSSSTSLVQRVLPLVEDLLFTNEKAHLVKNVVTFVVITRVVGRGLTQLYRRGLVRYANEWKVYLLTIFFRYAKAIPFVKAIIKKELGKILVKMEKDVAPMKEGEVRYNQLPSTGMSVDDLRKTLDYLSEMGHVDFLGGKVSGTVYHGGEELMDIAMEALRKFAFSNPLHPDVFPGVRKMEAEIVQMVLRMFNAPPTGCGTTTSGGTESILMACKAMRDWGLEVKGITEPEMVVPVSVHAAFDKAAGYFGIKILHAPVDEKTRKVNVKAVRRLVNANTIMIVGSAPSFPHGVIDDIQELSKIALKYNVGLHVDGCLGGFLIPFMDKAGFPIAPFDFRVKGVTSISCDTHKYGFAPKGSSVVLYRTPELRHHQYFVAPDWPGGIYASPTIAGSRPGSLIAACWTSMMYMGEKGYIDSTKRIVTTSRKIASAIKGIKGLRLYGEPELSVVAFGSDEINIYTVGAALTKKGWNLNTLQFPPSIHICCTYLTTNVEDDLIKDLTEIVEGIMADPKKGKAEGMAAIYGLAASIPDRSMIEVVARGFIDCLYIS